MAVGRPLMVAAAVRVVSLRLYFEVEVWVGSELLYWKFVRSVALLVQSRNSVELRGFQTV